MSTQVRPSSGPRPIQALRRPTTNQSAPVTAHETGDDRVIAALPLAIRRAAMDLFQLAARIEAEGSGRVGAPDAAAVPVIVDPDGFRVWVDDELAALTHREFRLLQVLVAHAGTVLTRQQLTRWAWDNPSGESRRTVDVHVRRLRVALGPAAARVTTVRNVGYRFD